MKCFSPVEPTIRSLVVEWRKRLGAWKLLLKVVFSFVFLPAASMFTSTVPADSRLVSLWYAAVRAYLLERAGDLEHAAELYAEASRAATSVPERDHLTREAARVRQLLRP